MNFHWNEISKFYFAKLGLDIKEFERSIRGLASKKENQAICDFVYEGFSASANFTAISSLDDFGSFMCDLKVYAVCSRQHRKTSDLQRLPQTRTTQERLQDRLNQLSIENFCFVNEWCAETDNEIFCLPPEMNDYTDGIQYSQAFFERLNLERVIRERKKLNLTISQSCSQAKRARQKI
jgi:hypothetical protein